MNRISYTHDGVIIFELENDEVKISSYSSDELTESNIAQQTACFIKWLLIDNNYESRDIKFENITFKILR